MGKNSLMSLGEILDATNGRIVGDARNFFFTSVVTDSRNVKAASLFVPLVGEKQDGHKFIQSAIEKGASVVFINRTEYEKNAEKYDRLSETVFSDDEKTCGSHADDAVQKSIAPVFIVVENTLYGLQDAARGYVEKFPKLIKCAVTGSSGKTTTKEMVVSVLKQKYNCVYTEGNLNSETGLPLSVFNIRSEHECGVFEMGMNRQNEIGEISSVLKPKYAIVTNIGTAHIGLLGSRENIAAEKRKIFDYIPLDGAAFVPADDDFADFITEKVNGKVVKFGKSVFASESGVEYKKDNGLFGTVFALNGLEINLPISGEYNYQNALAAVAIARELGVSDEQIKAGLESFHNVGGRMEIVRSELVSGKKATVVLDCYNANPDSMKKVIELCAAQKIGGKKVFVLGDMKELGENSRKAHEEIFSLVDDCKIDAAAFVGHDFKDAFSTFSKRENDNGTIGAKSDSDSSFSFTKPCFFESVDSEGLENFVLDNAADESIILLKGSNSMRLWELFPKIAKKTKNDRGGG